MEYTNEITINLPRERVIELFDSSENLSKWQPGLQSFEHIAGEPGQVGAQSRLVFDENGRKIEMLETITVRNFPDEFSAIYEAKNVKNISRNFFYADGADCTRWVAQNEFQFGGMMIILSLFMRKSFPKQTQTFMEQFKNFAENA